jgi:hypothetical protein
MNPSGERPEEGHVVLADPKGNEFCIVEPENKFLAGSLINVSRRSTVWSPWATRIDIRQGDIDCVVMADLNGNEFLCLSPRLELESPCSGDGDAGDVERPCLSLGTSMGATTGI